MLPLTLVADASTTPMPEAAEKLTSRDGQREATHTVWTSGSNSAGVWECTPGSFTTVREGYDEVCQVLSGTGRLVSDDGEVADLGPGCTVVIPDGWRGVWHIDSTMRKTFVILKR